MVMVIINNELLYLQIKSAETTNFNKNSIKEAV